MVLTGVVIAGCLCINAGAVEGVAVSTMEYEVTDAFSTRATGSFDLTVNANSRAEMDVSFPLAAGETVRIRANYTPEDASLDFGLIDPDGVFYYVNVTTGSIDKTIKIPENGNYTFAIVNNSGKAVTVSGFVRY